MSGPAGWRRSGGLPAETTSFVGRSRELAEVGRLLAASRLVTLTGVGGVGKTRLALRAAARARDDRPADYPDGVWLVELSPLQDSRLLGHTVYEALGVTDQTTRPVTEVLREYLAEKRLLLIADSSEHLAPGCGDFLVELLRTAPGLRVLATSRQALDVPGERVVLLHPLPTSEGTGYAADTDDAAALFADRAAEIRPGFALTEQNRPTVARLCNRLDGIPLAIELAAGRLRSLTVDQILARLDDRFHVLTEEGTALPGRHQTLRTTIGWSHELCSPAERLLWARLSVFSGGCDLDAAQEVCSDGKLTAAEVRAGVAGLVGKSILEQEETPTGPRLRMLDTVREYGEQWLGLIGDGEGPRLRTRRSGYAVRLAERGESDWFGPAQLATFRRTHAERANLRAALEYCLDTSGSGLGKGEAVEAAGCALHLAGTLWFYWVGCGFLGEGRQWLDRALAQDPRPTPARAKALWVNGYIADLQGDYPAALRMLTECQNQARATDDERAYAYATHRIGCAALLQDEHARAERLFTDALERYRRLGELNSNVLMGQVELAMALAFQGELERAFALCEEVRRVCDRHGEQWTCSYALYVLAQAELARGDHDQATWLAKESLRVNHAFHDLLGVVNPMELLALFAAVKGRYERAAVLQGGASRIWPSVGPQLFGSVYFNAPHRQCESLARDALGSGAYRAAYRRGTGLSLDAAVAYALEEEPPPRGENPLADRGDHC